MRTARLFVDIFALALLMPLLLLACGGSDEPTDGPSSDRATDEPETPGSGAAPTATDAPEPATATAPSAASGSDETDREALVALYNATNGKSWWNSANWLSDAPIGEWYGVTTDDDGRVIALGLGSNELSGEIPPELGSLSNLTYLILNGNDLSGCVPSSWEDRLNFDFSDLGGLPFC